MWFGNMFSHIIVTAQQWAQTLKINKAKIVRFSGLHKRDEYDYQNEDQKEEIGEISNLEE
jgi:inorganic triphosphatase YgiF